MAFSFKFVCLGKRLILDNAFSIFGSFVACWRLVDYRRACLADDIVQLDTSRRDELQAEGLRLHIPCGDASAG
jgi:hypothetical protein